MTFKTKMETFLCYFSVWSVASNFLELPAEKSLKPDAGSERKVTVVVQHSLDPAGRVPWVPGGWPWIV